MRKLFIVFALFLFLVPLTACNSGTSEQMEPNATVVRVVDGDTMVLNMNGEKIKVRLSDIDTPETVKANTAKQKFGEEASQFTKKLLPEGTEVTLEYVDGETTDQYDRHLGMLWIGDKLLNEELVREGLARVTYFYAKDTDKYTSRLKAAEEEAKEKKKNIWSIEGYVDDRGYNMKVAH